MQDSRSVGTAQTGTAGGMLLCSGIFRLTVESYLSTSTIWRFSRMKVIFFLQEAQSTSSSSFSP